MNSQSKDARCCEVCKKELVGLEADNMKELCDEHLEEVCALREWDMKLQKCCDRGWLQPCTCLEKRYRFSGSDRKKEAQNLIAWSTARTKYVKYRIPQNAFISGPRGVGKTNLARCILTEFVRQGYSAMECDTATLLSKAIELYT